MKAKYFKRIRASVNYYDVEDSPGLFGFDRPFDKPFEKDSFFVTVLARNMSEAISRAKRRGHFLDKPFTSQDPTDKMWARYRVKLHNKSNHWRNIRYFE